MPAAESAAATEPRASSFAWVHCVCASEACSAERARERASYTYIQGAGDDEENWARGLSPPLWWAWREALMTTAAVSPWRAGGAQRVEPLVVVILDP